MSLVNAIFGTASKINPEDIQSEFSPLLVEGEEIVGAFKVVRDLFVFYAMQIDLSRQTRTYRVKGRISQHPI